jgi:hypothetical protein
MGLTIHYGLKTEQTDADAVRSIVQRMHQLARQLPFQEVGEVLEFQGDECGFEDRNDPHRWLKIQAGPYLDEAVGHFKVTPLHILAFTAIPGGGSEPANIGLCRCPEFVDVERPVKKRVRTKLTGWRWHSFCKTQYASDPSVGGAPNFVRCHLSVISLLDGIQKQGLVEVEVSDESGYWEHRDERKLVETVGEWNAMVAAVVGQIKDAAGRTSVEAPITQFPNFEHLEAQGQDHLKKRPS